MVAPDCGGSNCLAPAAVLTSGAGAPHNPSPA
jgi:hypothetical protein